MLLRVLQLEPRGPSFWVRGAYWDWCRLLEQQQARVDGRWWCCVTCCVTRFLAIGFDNSASVLVECGA